MQSLHHPPAQPPRRTVLITGAGRGIGRATALAFAAMGWHVLPAGRDAARLASLADEIRDAGGTARPVVGDLAQADFWQRLSGLDGAVDVLVHNAMQPARFGLIENIDAAQIQSTLDSALTAGLRLAAAVLPAMKKSGWGRLIYVGSAVAEVGGHGQVAYTAAKAGLRGAVRSLALECARHGVTCNLVEPGFIDTERTREAVPAAVREALATRSAVGRAGTPQEVAAVIAFLASPSASYVTGACIPVTGGIELGLAPPPTSRQA